MLVRDIFRGRAAYIFAYFNWKTVCIGSLTRILCFIARLILPNTQLNHHSHQSRLHGPEKYSQCFTGPMMNFLLTAPPVGHWGVEQFQQYMRKHFWFLKCFEHKLVAKYCEASSAKIVFFCCCFIHQMQTAIFVPLVKLVFQAFWLSC